MQLQPGPHQTMPLEGIALTQYADKQEPLLICGKLYRSVNAFTYNGRVVHVCERFPCFDESDEMYENRYYHWHLFFDTLMEANAFRAQYAKRLPLLPCLSMRDSAESLMALPGRAVVYCEDERPYAIVSEKL